ncbi:hypothetical protein Zmor_001542 [Zophobas morio]|uniref:Uncharacterized protein n=1 Tax=Zophobas morio TaxID=2755281 RepID=A0AA38J7K4_9CUCU|nr:hypothetical protein Zmor_001542 [Zophobas morio]
MNSELRAGAQAYIPLDQITPPKSIIKVPCSQSTQSSRYSRKTVRANNGTGDTPRPILGTKAPFPRAILGRKEYAICENKENCTYPTKEYRSMNRNVHEVKINDEKSTPVKANTCSL